MGLAKGRITRDLIAMLSNWRHCGFRFFYGDRLGSEDEMGMENMARYTTRASFSRKGCSTVQGQVLKYHFLLVTALPFSFLQIASKPFQVNL